MAVRIENLSFAYQDKVIFKNLNMDLSCNKTVCIMGGSGTGKTTLANCICRQLDYDGNILFDVDGAKIAYVFQQPRLIPSLTVQDNIKFVLPRDMDKLAIDKKVGEVINKLHLDDCKMSYPSKISGGQASRVAIARALVTESDVLILDEPFKGLDVKLKKEIIDILIGLIENKSVIFITHDPEEALLIADKIYVFERKDGDATQVKIELEINQSREKRDMYGEYINVLRQKIYNIL